MENWFELEFLLLKIIRLQPSELEQMEFYRAEFLIENLKNHSEKESDARKKEEEQQREQMQQPNASSMMREAQKSMPKFTSPSFPKFKF